MAALSLSALSVSENRYSTTPASKQLRPSISRQRTVSGAGVPPPQPAASTAPPSAALRTM